MKLFPNNILPLLMSLLFFAACKTTKNAVVEEQPKAEETAKKWEAPLSEPIPAKTDDDKSLLWEITGNGLTEASYLYGTIHMIGKSNFYLSDLTKDRFDRTGQLALEIDMDDPALMMSAMAGMFLPDGKTLKDFYQKEDYEMVKSYFEDSLGMGMIMVERMKPILLTTMMVEQGEEEMVAYETVFLDMATKKGKETLGLETAAFQMSMLDSIPVDVQAEMLLEQIKKGQDEGTDMFGEMVDLYRKQDIESLYNMTVEYDGFSDFQQPLLITRNKNWIPVIERMSKEMPTFFAVGAAHLSGSDGVIELLKKAGFTMTPLKPRDE